MVFVPEGSCDRSLARIAWDIATPFRAATIGVVLREALSTRKTSGISCARSYRTLRDGSFGARSVVPTGRKYILRAKALIKLARMGVTQGYAL
jgi:hypothetical protein